MEMIRHASLEDARQVVGEWGGAVDSVEHVGSSASAVFRFSDGENVVRVLRLIDANFRTRENVEAELNFLEHLKQERVGVAAGLRNRKGEFTVEYAGDKGQFVASVVEYAEGVMVRDDSPYFGDEFWRAWGRNIGEIHRAAESYAPAPSVPRLWQWDEEGLWSWADELIPQDDVISRDRMRELFATCRALPKSLETFGIVHADHGAQNFHYDPNNGKITAFDFGNACYHWFVSDVAIALSTVRLKPNREEIKMALLAGYREVKPLPENLEELLGLFIRLRTVYVYLARLYVFGQEPNEKQREILAGLTERIRTGTNW